MTERIRIHHLFNLKYHRLYGNDFGQHFYYYDQLKENNPERYADIAGKKYPQDIAHAQHNKFNSLLQIPEETVVTLSKERDSICKSCVTGEHCLSPEVMGFDERIGGEFVFAAKKLGLIDELSINGVLNDSDFKIQLKMKVIWEVLDSLTKWQEYFEKDD